MKKTKLFFANMSEYMIQEKNMETRIYVDTNKCKDGFITTGTII